MRWDPPTTTSVVGRFFFLGVITNVLDKVKYPFSYLWWRVGDFVFTSRVENSRSNGYICLMLSQLKHEVFSFNNWHNCIIITKTAAEVCDAVPWFLCSLSFLQISNLWRPDIANVDKTGFYKSFLHVHLPFENTVSSRHLSFLYCTPSFCSLRQ